MATPTMAPMDMRAVDSIPDGPGWLYEPKWDGFRCLAHRNGDGVSLTSKSGQPLARYFPEIVEALGRLQPSGFSLDGELVVPAGETFSFEALQQRIHPAPRRVALLAKETPALYLVFDLLRLGREDLSAAGIERRRPALEAFAAGAFAGEPNLRLSPATTLRSVAEGWYARSQGGSLDGVVAKKFGVPYASGRRDAAVKIKPRRTADCVVGGFRYAWGSPPRVASLLLGMYDELGRLDYVGFCSAFPAHEREALVARLAPHTGEPGFTGAAPGGAPSRWSRDDREARGYIKLAPELVLEVEYDSVGGGRMRHGTRPLRWRFDKPARACTLDQLNRPEDATVLLDR